MHFLSIHSTSYCRGAQYIDHEQLVDCKVSANRLPAIQKKFGY